MTSLASTLAYTEETTSPKRGNAVFSNERTVLQPKFTSKKFKTNGRQQADGLLLLKSLEGDAMPLVFFDPQYRSVLDKQSYGNEGKRQIGRAELSQMSDALIRDFLNEIERVLMPSGHLMLWVDKYILCSGVQSLTGDLGLKLVDMVTWDKCKMGMGYRTRRHSEHLIILQKAPVRAKGVWHVHNIPDVWQEKIDKADKEHPHCKPIQLQKRLIEAVTNKGDIIVDPAAGSYSVMKSALLADRNFIGCDLRAS